MRRAVIKIGCPGGKALRELIPGVLTIYRGVPHLRAALILSVLLASGIGPKHAWAQAADTQAADAQAVSDSALVAQALADSLEKVAAAKVLPELTEAYDLLDQMHAAMESLLVFEQERVNAGEEKRQLLRVRAGTQVELVRELPPKLLRAMTKLEGKGAPLDSIRQVFSQFIVEKALIYSRTFEFWTDEINQLRSQRGITSTRELGDLEARIEEARTSLAVLLDGMVTTLDTADSLRIDTADAWVEVDRLVLNTAQTLASRMQIAVSQRNKLAKRVKDEEKAGSPEAEIGSDRIQLRYAERRVHGIARSLDATVMLLDKRGVSTTEYKKSSIRATGEVNKDLLDPQVLLGLIAEFSSDFWEWIKDNLPTVLVRMLIVIAFVLVFRFGFRLLWWILQISKIAKMPRLTAALVSGLVTPFGTLLGFFAGLWFLGVNPGALLAGLGVASVIIGLALQESLANLASGFFILATRPYDVDDIVQTGSVLGTVKAMGLANTTIRTFDGRRLMVPNRLIWGQVIENRSAEALRRVDITVRVSYDQDLDTVLQLLRTIVLDSERVLKKPAPDIFVKKLDESWVIIAVRPWVKNADWWPLLTELPRTVRLRFAEAGVEIPFPRSDIAISRTTPTADPQSGEQST